MLLLKAHLKLEQIPHPDLLWVVKAVFHSNWPSPDSTIFPPRGHIQHLDSLKISVHTPCIAPRIAVGSPFAKVTRTRADFTKEHEISNTDTWTGQLAAVSSRVACKSREKDLGLHYAPDQPFFKNPLEATGT